MLKLKLITPPAVEPVTAEEAKGQLRIDDDDTTFDTQLDVLIHAARQWCEEYQNRAYITQEWELALDRWPCGRYIRLPRPPLIEVESITVTNSDGIDTPYSDYTVDDYSEPARIIGMWPHSKLAETNGIVIRYEAGYGESPDEVPKKIRQAIMLLALHWFENGMCEPPPAVLWLLAQDRVIPI